MKIEYLISLEEHKILGKSTFPREGLSIGIIKKIEDNLNEGRLFPKAFREFLYLAGNYNSLGLSIGVGLKGVELYVGVVEYFEEEMAKRGLSMNRPYVIFHNMDGAGFGFIYLDEGDDPQPYHYELYADMRPIAAEPSFKYNNANTFSELIDSMVNRKLKGLTAW